MRNKSLCDGISLQSAYKTWKKEKKNEKLSLCAVATFFYTWIVHPPTSLESTST